MFYGFLADLIGLIHLGYVSFVVVGELLILLGIGLRWRWIRAMSFRLVHLAMILIVALESLGHLMCPLTTWENSLRELAGQPVVGDSFVADLLNHVMFFNTIPYDHWIMKSGYVSFAAVVILTFVVAPPCRHWRDSPIRWPSRCVLIPAVLATLGSIFLYTAVCMQDYKDSADERLPVYFMAFSGLHFLGMAMVCWALAPPKAREEELTPPDKKRE